MHTACYRTAGKYAKSMASASNGRCGVALSRRTAADSLIQADESAGPAATGKPLRSIQTPYLIFMVQRPAVAAATCAKERVQALPQERDIRAGRHGAHWAYVHYAAKPCDFFQ
jgi:hypothetical protein